MKPSVLIPIVPGTNRDRDLALAFELAGANPIRLPVADLAEGATSLDGVQILALAGGFSYGDALGAGHVWGLDVATRLGDGVREAVGAERLCVIGICNGFQALVASGLLPGGPDASSSGSDNGRSNGGVAAALRGNDSDRFECRWVQLRPANNSSPWLSAVTGDLRCPVAHGEGRFATNDPDALFAAGQVALTYVDPAGPPLEAPTTAPVSETAGYPANPNGSVADIAGITDPTGRIFGLMPHPENHVVDRQDPAAGRSGSGGNCLPLFEGVVRALRT